MNNIQFKASLSWNNTAQSLESSPNTRSIERVKTVEADDFLCENAETDHDPFPKLFDGQRDFQSSGKTKDSKEDGMLSAPPSPNLPITSRVSKMLFVGTAGTSNSNLKPQPTNATLDVKSLEIEMAEAKLNPSATSGPNLSGRTKEEQTSIGEDDTPQSHTSGFMDMIFKVCCFWRSQS